MSDDLSMAMCKRRLLILWLGIGGASLLLLLVRTLVGAYAPDENTIWGWFLPNIVPTLSLMIGVIVMDDVRRRNQKADAEEAPASGFLFMLSYWMSAVYLSLMLALILYEAFAATGPTMAELTSQTGYLMGPFQGLIAASLGAFFTKG